jgi:hypothetical protein
MMSRMSDERPSDVLGALPRTRPHRRSDKRGAPQEPATEQAALPDQASAEAPGRPDAARDHAAATVPPAAGVPEPKPAPVARTARSAGKSGPRAASGKTSASKRSAATPARAKRPAAQKKAPSPRRVAKPKPVATPSQAKARVGGQAEPELRAPAAKSQAGRPDSTPAKEATSGPVGTAVQAAAELAEIGLSMSARALRNALSRLPRP